VVKRVGDVAGTQMEQKVVAVGTPEDVAPAGVFGQVNYAAPGVYCMTAAAAAAARPGAAANYLSYSLCCDTDTTDSSLNFAPQNYGAGVRVRSATRGGSVAKGMATETLTRGVRIGDDTKSATKSKSRSLYLGDTDVRERGISISSAPMTTEEIVSQISTKPKGPGLIAMLTTLQSDGGLPAGTLEERVLRTTVFALAALQSQIQTGTSLYTSHLKKMAKFIEDNAGAVIFDVQEAVNYLRMASLLFPGDWIDENEKLSLTTGTIPAPEMQRLSLLCQKVV
jgi:hypothetical protein